MTIKIIFAMKVLPISNNETLSIMEYNLKVIKENIESKRPNLSYEQEFIRRISQTKTNRQCEEARNYFLKDFSLPILLYISTNLYHQTSWEEIFGEYYEFISKENKESHTPYYKVTLYSKQKDTTLRKYITVITTRYFVDEKIKEDKLNGNMISIDSASTYCENKSGNTVIENPWFNLLIGNKGDDESNDIKPETYQKIDYVLSKLPERETKAIELMVMDDLSALEAFEELEPYLQRNAKTPTSTWTKKQKQDAMSLLKGRALKHFKIIIEHENIDFR